MSAETQAKAIVPEGVTSGERSQLTAGAAPTRRSGVMCATLALTQRELQAVFYSPIAYVLGFIFLFTTGYFLVIETLVAGQEASLRPLFEFMAGVLVFALPILTMRTLSDEFASGAIETLMTAPVTDGSVILGKFFGVFLFYVCLLATTLVHWILAATFSQAPVASVVLLGYLGMLLLGALFIAVGIFASCCTRYQLLAATIAISVLAILTFLADYGAEYLGTEALRAVCAYVNIFGHFTDFTKGILDTSSLVFFLSGIVFFLFLATKVLESRRWR